MKLNAGGLSADSLAQLDEFWGGEFPPKPYNYVPGLKPDDPDDLIMLYTKRPTRFVWHGAFPTVFEPRKWVVVTPGFGYSNPDRWNGELSERIETAEFKRRLLRTLNYLKENDRDNWQIVEKDQMEFLQGIKE